MLNLLVIIIGVALGTILASVFMMAIMLLYPRVIKVFMKRYLKICEELAEMILNEDKTV